MGRTLIDGVRVRFSCCLVLFNQNYDYQSLIVWFLSQCCILSMWSFFLVWVREPRWLWYYYCDCNILMSSIFFKNMTWLFKWKADYPCDSHVIIYIFSCIFIYTDVLSFRLKYSSISMTFHNISCSYYGFIGFYMHYLLYCKCMMWQTCLSYIRWLVYMFWWHKMIIFTFTIRV